VTPAQPIDHAPKPHFGAARIGPRRVGLVGAESTGKSTLAEALGAELPACVVPEALRDFVEREGRPPRQDEQRDLMLEQAAREEEIAARCPHPWLVADPAPLMTAAYSVEYFDDASLLPEGLDLATGYAFVIWCAPDLPWQAESGMRDGTERRRSVDAILRANVMPMIEDLGVPVLRVTGSLEDRVRAALAWQPKQHGAAT